MILLDDGYHMSAINDQPTQPNLINNQLVRNPGGNRRKTQTIPTVPCAAQSFRLWCSAAKHHKQKLVGATWFFWVLGVVGATWFFWVWGAVGATWFFWVLDSGKKEKKSRKLMRREGRNAGRPVNGGTSPSVKGGILTPEGGP